MKHSNNEQRLLHSAVNFWLQKVVLLLFLPSLFFFFFFFSVLSLCLFETLNYTGVSGKDVTSSTDDPLVGLLPPARSNLQRNKGNPFIRPAIRTKRFKHNFKTDVFSILFNPLLKCSRFIWL